MLLSEFSDLLARDFPELHSTLHVGDLIRFAVLAAEVVSRSKDAWHFKDAFSIIPFLQAALEVGLSTDLCHQLWHSISPILSQFHVKPGQLIKEHGYRSDLSVKIPEFTLLAPVKECLLCNNANKGRQKLHYRSQLHGYLYDLDGVHTAGINVRHTTDQATIRRKVCARTIPHKMDEMKICTRSAVTIS